MEGIIVNVFFAVIGWVCGTIVAGGVGALLTSVGMLTRLAYHSGTQEKVKHYENCVVLGLTAGIFLSIYAPGLMFEKGQIIAVILFVILGICMGAYVGCLAMALAEALDVSAIMLRRINVKKYLWMISIAAALGKLVGNIIYFFGD